MNPILKRTVSALTVAAGVAALFLYAPLPVVFPVVLALSLLAQLEFYRMAKAYEPVAGFGLAVGALWLAGVAWCPCQGAAGALLPFLFAALAAYVLVRRRYARPVGTIAVTALGVLYVPYLLSFFLRVVQTSPESRAGLYTLGALLAVTKASDMGGFAFGVAFGRHKMCPSVSPKKSWEGFAGSVCASALVACLFCWAAQRCGWGETVKAWRCVTYPVAAAAGAALAAVGTVGDLIESRLKRECGVKDSSSFLPAGMGGVLDTLDSILFVPALVSPLLAAAQGGC